MSAGCPALALPSPPPAVLLIAVTFKKDGPDPQNVDFKVKLAGPGLSIPALLSPCTFQGHCPSRGTRSPVVHPPST